VPHTFIAGVDLGATNARVAIANADGEIEARRAFALPSGSPVDVLQKVGRTIDDLARGVWVGARAAAIGVALPGAVDTSRGTVASIANLPGWDDVPIAEILGSRDAAGGRIPVAIENDANAAAVGEGWLGAAKRLTDYVFVALGTGIGCGIVSGGRLVRGAHFLAGEAAFFRMTREQVRAGGWDACLESLVGGRAAQTQAETTLGAKATAAQLFDAARGGNADAAAWQASVQEYLAMAVVDMVSLLDPQMVVFGGGVAHAQGEALLGPVRELVHRCVPVRVPIVRSELGEDAQVLGAVRLASEQLAVRNT
jgi:glucokinase